MTIRAAAGNPDTTPCVAFENNHLVGEDCARTLSGDHESRVTDTGQSVVTRAHGINCNASQNFDAPPEAAETLTVCHRGGVVENSRDEYVVRRLTPRECERLQGFPDDWTRIPYRGKPAEECPDGPRYKAMGNSWGTNCAEWILRRLLAARHVWHPEQDEPSTTERIP